ncbi:MAG: hypothetical protein HZB62_14140 [Nitrospirae bacterium]|nr:hypothetical protein [Nitrospirota bacterium]
MIRVLISLFMAGCLFPSPYAQATEPQTAAVNFLRTKYHKIEAKLQKNSFNMPLYIESREEEFKAAVDVYGIVDHPFEMVSRMLEIPANWCDIALLHINDKACTYTKSDNTWLVTLYSGRKFYQPPEDAHQLNYVFRVRTQQHDYLALQLNAAQGPLSTKDHWINAEIIPLDKDKTLIHLSYAFGYGRLGRMAMKTYFATIGRSKIGFSAVGTDDHGNPVYVGGIKGAIERNVVRYYSAILAYLDSLKFPADQQFERRISRWYDLTDHHKKQLHELEKEQYLANKRLELKNQMLLKKAAAQEVTRKL